MTIGDRIKKARQEKGLSQKELGRKLGVSQQMIGQWETDKANPKKETIAKIAKALNVSPNILDIRTDEFFFGDSFVAREWVEDKNYKPIIDLLKKQQKLNSESDKDILLPTEDAFNQVYQNILLSSFNQLNWRGKEKAIEDIENLTYNPKYVKSDEPPKD